MFHQVKRFNANGDLIEIIPPEKLAMLDDDKFGGDKPQPKRKAGVYLNCEFCGDRFKAFSRTTCKKSACERKKREQKKKGKECLKKIYVQQ